MVLVLVAISFYFGPLRSVTMGFRVFIGIIVGLLFKYAQDLLGHPVLYLVLILFGQRWYPSPCVALPGRY